MAGSALRAWELARALQAAGHRVRLAAPPGSRAPAEGGPQILERPTWRWADVVLSPAWTLPPRAFVGRHLLVADGATPLPAELAAMPETTTVQRRRRTASARLPLVLGRADAVLAAGGAQGAWWRERLAAAGRPGVPVLDVPFGIPEADPPPESEPIPGVPDGWRVVLWWGGVWPWLDLDTLLEARARLGPVPIAVVVPTARRPGGGAVGLDAAGLAARCARHRLRPPQVVPLERWIPYAGRHRVLRRAAAVVVLHHPGEEARLSFRTRALDALWAGVPLVLSEGGAVSKIVRERGWGAVVPPGDPRAAAAALELVLAEREAERCRLAMAADRDSWRWPAVVRPLVEALPALPQAVRSSLSAAALRAAIRLRAGRRTTP